MFIWIKMIFFFFRFEWSKGDICEFYILESKVFKLDAFEFENSRIEIFPGRKHRNLKLEIENFRIEIFEKSKLWC